LVVLLITLAVNWETVWVGYGSRFMGMTQGQSSFIGSVLSNAVTSPANIIANEATKEKKQ